MPAKDKEPTLDDLMGDGEDSLLDAIEAQDVAAEDDGDMEGIDPSHPILSVDQQRKAKAEARVAIEDERRKAALKAFIAKEKQRLRTEEGLTIGDGVRDEMVTVVIDLPKFADRLTVNMEPFFHGHEYPVPRHVADSLREQQSRMWAHQEEIDGHSMADRMLNETIRGMKPTAIIGKAA